MFILSVAVPADYEASGVVLAAQLRRTIEAGLRVSDEELLASLAEVPEGEGRFGVLVYRKVE